jgi:hypothetical protein
LNKIEKSENLPASAAFAAATAAFTASAATTVAATAVSSTASRLRTRDVYVQRTPVHFGAVQLINRIFSFVLIGHFDERETSWLSGSPVRDDADALYFSVLSKRCFQLLLRSSITQIPDKNVNHSTLL